MPGLYSSQAVVQWTSESVFTQQTITRDRLHLDDPWYGPYRIIHNKVFQSVKISQFRIILLRFEGHHGTVAAPYVFNYLYVVEDMLVYKKPYQLQNIYIPASSQFLIFRNSN